jgi:hypothetical protein
MKQLAGLITWTQDCLDASSLVQSCAFVINIRDISGDDSELRESLKTFGWVEYFPALADENGVTLVGHRRLKIADEEKIEPVVKTVTLGAGDVADAERLSAGGQGCRGARPSQRHEQEVLLAARQRGEGFISYRTAELRMRKALVEVAAGGDGLGVFGPDA